MKTTLAARGRCGAMHRDEHADPAEERTVPTRPPRSAGSTRTPQISRRRSAEEARLTILAAAEAILVDEGLHALTVRSVAQRVGMTDMGVNHHFGSRDELTVCLLDHLGARYRKALAALVADWLSDGAELPALLERLSAFYEAGQARLAVALHQAGWRDTGSPVFEPVARSLYAAKRPGFENGSATAPTDTRGDMEETMVAIAAMHQGVALAPLFGTKFSRGVGLASNPLEAARVRCQWWLATLSKQFEP